MLHNCFQCDNYITLMVNIMGPIESIHFRTDISPKPNLYVGRYVFSQNIFFKIGQDSNHMH